ncbi:MAG: Cysteine desulfurase [Firmicutes bacterium ADurb.Bin248]|nr:MAG: Cysteine desulfurase [Firmicutes bacterium ADurb.Bin248]
MIYLDNSATTRTLDAAADAARTYMTTRFFNPSAAYSAAAETEKAVEAARARLAFALDAKPEEIVYTSGATESNNAAISGALKAMRGKGRLIVGATEHPSAYEVVKAYSRQGYDVVEAPVDSTGAVDLAALSTLLTEDTRLVSVMQVNNEVGAVNDCAAIYRAVKAAAPEAVVHTDGVQGFLKVPFDAKDCDFYALSAHKFHGPKGVGALYVKTGVRFAGGQAEDRRSGTTNTPGIMGMDAAVADYLAHLEEYRKHMMACKLRLAKNLSGIRDVLINGPKPAQGAPHILNVSILGVRGEVMLHALEAREVFVSTGSACSAHKKGKNRILTAMGVTGARQEGALRLSLCPFNTLEEMDAAAAIIAEQAAFLRKYKRR